MRIVIIKLKTVTITRLDLKGKDRYFAGSAGISNFAVTDERGERTFIRISARDRETNISEIERFRVGDVVDIEVTPADWRIGKHEGTSYYFISIMRSL